MTDILDTLDRYDFTWVDRLDDDFDIEPDCTVCGSLYHTEDECPDS